MCDDGGSSRWRVREKLRDGFRWDKGSYGVLAVEAMKRSDEEERVQDTSSISREGIGRERAEKEDQLEMV
jgi:hypothetical protein